VRWKSRRKLLKSLKTAMGIGACCLGVTPANAGVQLPQGVEETAVSALGPAGMTTIERLGSRKLKGTEKGA
jgi:hypothetical protein